MNVKVYELKEGCILAQDIYSKSSKPIVRKNTILNLTHLRVLKAFMVKNVEINQSMADGEPFASNQPQNDSDTVQLYMEALKAFEKEFSRWQSGLPIDMFAVRKLFLPLLSVVTNQKEVLFNLYHFSTSKTYIFHHCLTVGLLSAYLAKKLNYDTQEIKQIGMAGLLSDFGMTKLPSKFIYGEGQLSEKEYKQLKEHPIVSAQMVKSLPSVTKEMVLGIMQHHERENGSGYPYGFQTNKIHGYAKIIAVADVFHSMICERHYRQKQSPFKVLEVLKTDYLDQFDTKTVDLLIQEIVHLAVGTKVLLTNYEIGEIVFVQPQSPTRPILKMEDGSFLSLVDHRELYIDEILK